VALNEIISRPSGKVKGSITETNTSWTSIDSARYSRAVDDSPDHLAPDDDRPEVDPSLIEEMLRLAPGDRLALNDRLVDTILELRRSFEERHGQRTDGTP
jgi:hypothetical protein